jgi:hypothetical protein
LVKDKINWALEKGQKEIIMKDQKERTELISRPSVLTGSALLLTGGIAGRISNAVAAPCHRHPHPLRPCPGNGPSSTRWKPAKWEPSKAITSCIECHSPEEFPNYKDGMNHQQGHMECLPCHVDHTTSRRKGSAAEGALPVFY